MIPRRGCGVCFPAKFDKNFAQDLKMLFEKIPAEAINQGEKHETYCTHVRISGAGRDEHNGGGRWP
jgi:hypothetical protein